ncbi:MAG: MOSC domain-containing protein [Pseudomonadales bacterium]|nr:MOSC domain-containing protein [Pseudomonadales bacterium]
MHTNPDDNARISELVIYPIKGCKGQQLQTAQVTQMGLAGDREFSVILNGRRANQKQVPLLHKLGAQWNDKNQLTLSFPDTTDFVLNTNITASKLTVEIHSKPVSMLDMGDEVSNWLSSVMCAEVKLVRAEQAFDWFFPLPEFSLIHNMKQTKFVDAAPILLTNQNSLDALNKRIDADTNSGKKAQPLPMDRFRPNIVVSNLSPYQEDDIAKFIFPALKLQRVAVCERCVVTTTDQQSGLKGKEPLRTLSKFRKRKNDYAGGIMFGIYLTPKSEGSVSVGDILQ